MQNGKGNTFIILTLLLCIELCAQERPKYRFSYEAAVFNENFNIPFFKDYTHEISIHPGGRIGIEYLFKERRIRSNFQNLNFLAYYHQTLHTALILNTEYGERYKLQSGFYGDWMAGVGYFQAIYDANQYKLENEEFVKVSRVGYPRAVISTNIGMGYDFGINFKYPISCFFRYSFLSELPFRKPDSIFGAHSCIQLGIRFTHKNPVK